VDQVVVVDNTHNLRLSTWKLADGNLRICSGLAVGGGDATAEQTRSQPALP
jgi:hypothetical protein